MERSPSLKASYDARSSEQIRGWTLPTTLFAIALLLASVELVTFESIDARHIIAERLVGERQHQRALSAIRDVPSARSGCSDIAISNDSSYPMYEVCGEELLPLTSVPPSSIDPTLAIDYDALFSTASTCPTTPAPTELPHKTAPIAAQDCFWPTSPRNGATVVENLRGDIVAISPPSSGTARLASPGSILLSGELVIASDLLIVSGGDVAIRAIRGTSSATLRVTIISSLGGIAVDKIYGSVSLLIAGRSTLVAPETPKSSSYPLPPLRAASLYGFRAVTREGG